MFSEKDVNVGSKALHDKPYSSSPSSISHDDIEGAPVPGTTVQLKRRLQSRHLQMIAIGGTIGTGLFIGSGNALANAGPAGALIAYAFVGTLVYSVMVALGEMATFLPVSGAFTAYAARFVDPSLGFAMGWIYWFSWAITYALELTASGLIIQYWRADLNIGIFIGIFWAVITAVNFLPVSFYGEIEFYFASIKVLTVIGFMIFAICIDAGAGQHGYLGFETWKNPGAFAASDLVKNNDAVAKFVGFWAVLIQAGFSYQGTELVGIAAGETSNPRKTVPAAIKKTFYRIVFFFVLTIFFIGLLVPYNDDGLLSDTTDASSSPFVIAANLAGVKILPSIINAVLLCVVLSAANSNVYSGSRILVGLSEQGSAPKWMGRTTARGVPYYAVAFTAAFGLLGFMNESSSSSTVFSWLLNITGVAGFITWTCINISHIAFMRALAARGFTSFMPWNTSDFFVAYISLILFAVLYGGHKLVYRQPLVKPIEADLDTGRKEIEEMHFEEVEPVGAWQKFWAW
ncbi:unnamed protein product [Aureobasidium pullulans]|nr:unnamed protein product [Aureobasidium pullulans]